MGNGDRAHPRDIVATFATAVRQPLVLYWFCKDIDGYNGEGTFVVMGCRVMRRYDVHERQSFYEPLSTYDHILRAQRFNQRLMSGGAPRWASNHVVISFKVFDSASTAPQGRLPLPNRGDIARGNHAVYVVGWEDEGESLNFINSWGRGWGNNGYGNVSREYLERYLTDAYLSRGACTGPSRFTWSRLTAAQSNRDFTRVWLMENPRTRVRFSHLGHGHVWVLYETWSFVDSCPVEIIELRTGQGFIIGWAHLHHLTDAGSRTSLLKELFVWPLMRRRGYGTMLEQVACRRARAWSQETIQISRYAADDLQRQLAPGRNFGAARGYRWILGSQARLNVKGIGEKLL